MRAFLLQRKQEMGGGGGGSDLLNALMPDALQAVDSSEVAGMLAGVEGVMSDLNAPKMRQLLMLRSSPRCVLCIYVWGMEAAALSILGGQ